MSGENREPSGVQPSGDNVDARIAWPGKEENKVLKEKVRRLSEDKVALEAKLNEVQSLNQQHLQEKQQLIDKHEAEKKKLLTGSAADEIESLQQKMKQLEEVNKSFQRELEAVREEQERQRNDQQLFEGKCESEAKKAQERLEEQVQRLSMEHTTGSPPIVNLDEGMFFDLDHMYDMSHPCRGKFIIINNKTFNENTQMHERTGTDVDAANLYSRFKELGFEVTIHNNLKASDMLMVMIDASKEDHSSCDCFAVAILSHGDEGIVYGIDVIIPIDRLVAPFKGDSCQTLVGKPKLFFVQACRGQFLDHGVLQHDAQAEAPQVYRIPYEADILYAYSTVAGYFSWRNSSKGSWFIQALCNMLQKYGTSRDLLWILTRVNHQVAYEFISSTSQAFMNKKKQVPSVVHMLTKDLVFTPK